MSRSALHAHFKTVTTMSPLQYQKQLRLQEARRLMLGQAMDAARAAYEVGYESPHDYLGEAALMDLHDLAHNTRDGLHMASLAGAWTALVEGFGGMRARDGRLAFAPRLPSGIRRLRFRVRYRGRCVVVTANHEEATYQVLEGPPITVRHYGQELELAGEPVTRPIEEAPNLPRPAQPPGRAPARRGSAHGGPDSTLSA